MIKKKTLVKSYDLHFSGHGTNNNSLNPQKLQSMTAPEETPSHYYNKIKLFVPFFSW